MNSEGVVKFAEIKLGPFTLLGGSSSRWYPDRGHHLRPSDQKHRLLANRTVDRFQPRGPQRDVQFERSVRDLRVEVEDDHMEIGLT